MFNTLFETPEDVRAGAMGTGAGLMVAACISGLIDTGQFSALQPAFIASEFAVGLIICAYAAQSGPQYRTA